MEIREDNSHSVSTCGPKRLDPSACYLGCPRASERRCSVERVIRLYVFNTTSRVYTAFYRYNIIFDITQTCVY